MADDRPRKISNAALAFDLLVPSLIAVAMLVVLVIAFIKANPRY
ncbi:MAG TPA: hypothetical protein VGL44_17270 [Gaiellales bacterium]